MEFFEPELETLDKPNSFKNLMVRQTHYLKLIAKASIEMANNMAKPDDEDVSYLIDVYTLTELENLKNDMQKHWVDVELMNDDPVAEWTRRLENIINVIESTGTPNE